MGNDDLASLVARLRQAASADEVRTILDKQTPSAELVTALALELRSAHRAREVLLASVAHDLRNPLNTFAMSAGLLRDDLEGGDFDRTRGVGLLARMDRASTRMQTLIEELLEASRILGGSVEVHCREENAAAIARAAIERGRPVVADKSASLVEDPITADATMNVDKARAVEGLVKLVSVALKSAGENGSIRIGVETRSTGGVFTVRAIPQRGLPATAHDESRGGLALLIARGLFGAMGGTITVETTPEGGRTVVAFGGAASPDR